VNTTSNNGQTNPASARLIEGGLRISGTPRLGQPGAPLITIITSTFNAEQDLPLTIKSIREQDYQNIQWIVADGASRDSTVELLRENEDIIDYWFSAPDTGIYDAWNKALVHARGEWIQFIGAGDELAAQDTLSSVSPILATAHPQYDLVYGNLHYISEKGRMFIEEVGMPWDKMKMQWEGFRPKLPGHPAVFHHKTIMCKTGALQEKYRIAGDSHFLLKHILNKDPLYIPLLIDRMPIGGISANLSASLLIAKEIFDINKDVGIKAPILHVIFEVLKLSGKVFLARCVPSSVSFFVADVYRVIIGKKKRWTIN